MLYKKNDNIGPYKVTFPHKEGSYAETYRVKDNTGKTRFLKLINYAKLNRHQIDDNGHVVEAEISNLNLSYKLKLTEGEEAFNNTPDHKLLECTITLNYKDGTKESFNTRMPPNGENDIGVGYCGKRNGMLSVNPHFSRSINASEVASVELNGVEVFVARWLI